MRMKKKKLTYSEDYWHFRTEIGTTNWEEIAINITVLTGKRVAVPMEQKTTSANTQDPKDSGHDFSGTIQTWGKAATDPDPAV